MRKSTLFISAALTTFMLAIMFGVASAYQKIVQNSVPTAVAAQAQPTDVLLPTVAATDMIVPTTGTITVEQAATLASDVLGRTDLYTGEIAMLDGVQTYLITFSSGDLVYVSMTGQIVSITKIPAAIVVVPSYTNNNNNNGGGGNGGGNNSGSNNGSGHDDDDDDDHDDEDH
ncbi:MAG: hypothetical protein HZB50_06025 [Chloroflexi bacterium]|nr:hypothetical protein [Chloroflexota bacterium]